MRFDDPPKREEHRFVLRVWREPSASTPGWRGSIYEASSAVNVVSGKLRDLWDFIVLRLDKEPDVRAAGETPRDE